MAATAASGNPEGATLTVKAKGELGNSIRVKVVADRLSSTGAFPASGANAPIVSVSGNDIGVSLVCSDLDDAANTILNAKSQVYSAFSGSADVQSLVSVTTGSATGADTGAVFTGDGGGFANLVGGADAPGTVFYEDLAAASGHGWRLINSVNDKGAAVDILERTNSDDAGILRVEAAAATGASLVVKEAGALFTRLVAKGVLDLQGPT